MLCLLINVLCYLCRTIAFVATVISWPYPTLNKFYLILSWISCMSPAPEGTCTVSQNVPSGLSLYGSDFGACGVTNHGQMTAKSLPTLSTTRMWKWCGTFLTPYVPSVQSGPELSWNITFSPLTSASAVTTSSMITKSRELSWCQLCRYLLHRWLSYVTTTSNAIICVMATRFSV